MRPATVLLAVAGLGAVALLALEAQARQAQPMSEAGAIDYSGMYPDPAAPLDWSSYDPLAGAYGAPPALEPSVIMADGEGGDAGALDTFVMPVAYALGDALTLGSGMKTSPSGLSSLMQLEGFSATPYQDAGGYSIGYGHYLKPGEWYASIDQAGAQVLLQGDVRSAERSVNALVRAPLTQAMFDSLVSFVYNVGAANFRTSTLLKRLNARDYAGAQGEFSRWRYTRQGGVKVESAVLIDRRALESAMFASAGVPAGGVAA